MKTYGVSPIRKAVSVIGRYLVDRGAVVSLTVGVCNWEADEDGFWGTSCHNYFTYEEDGPRENSAKFCQFCGKHIRDIPAEGRK